MEEVSKKIILKNDPKELSLLGNILEEFRQEHQLPPYLIFRLDLVLDELITNIISYGYQDKDVHDIFITFRLDDFVLWVEVVDDAIAFNPIESKDPEIDLSIEDRPIGGLGIYFVKKFVEDLVYQRVGNENHLSFKINFHHMLRNSD